MLLWAMAWCCAFCGIDASASEGPAARGGLLLESVLPKGEALVSGAARGEGGAMASYTLSAPARAPARSRMGECCEKASGAGVEDRAVGYGSRVRRGRPGRLGFGTFEAWCHWRSGGADSTKGPSLVWRGVPVLLEAGAEPVVEGGAQAAAAGDAAAGASAAGDTSAKDASVEWAAGRSGAPPSLRAVVRYFEEALGEEPVFEEGGRVRFERWEGFSWGASWRRCLLSGGGGAVCLEWWANDDFGLSELREFFEAPLFELSESLVLHQWFGEGGWHWGVLRGARLAMGVLSRGDFVYVRIRWWQPPV